MVEFNLFPNYNIYLSIRNHNTQNPPLLSHTPKDSQYTFQGITALPDSGGDRTDSFIHCMNTQFLS